MSKLAVLEYKGEKILFSSLSTVARDQLLELPDSPFKESNQRESAKFFLSKGYITVIDGYGDNRTLKITESKAGKFIKVSDNVVHLNTILGLCNFCKDQEENEIVTRRIAKNQKVAIFNSDFCDMKAGEEIKYSGSQVQTSLGALTIKNLVKNNIVSLKEVPVYNGRFNRNPNSPYNSNMDLVFDGSNVRLGCQTFKTSSLVKLANPLKEYLGK